MGIDRRRGCATLLRICGSYNEFRRVYIAVYVEPKTVTRVSNRRREIVEKSTIKRYRSIRE